MADLSFGTYLAPKLMPMYAAVAGGVGRHLGLTTELVAETTYESCIQDVYDVCFVCSLPYVMFERQGLAAAEPVAAPVLAGARYGGRPIYFSDVIVHRDSDVHTMRDLRGATWAYNEPLSHSGYGITRYHLVQSGETHGFFGQVIEAGFHETAIEMVRRREVDGSAIDSQVLELSFLADPELADVLRVVETLGPSTIQPLAVSRRLPVEQRNAIVDVVLNLHEDPLVAPYLAGGLVERFVEIGPEGYDDIRRMVDACEEADFMVLR